MAKEKSRFAEASVWRWGCRRPVDRIIASGVDFRHAKALFPAIPSRRSVDIARAFALQFSFRGDARVRLPSAGDNALFPGVAYTTGSLGVETSGVRDSSHYLPSAARCFYRVKPVTVTGCDPEGTLSRVGGQVFVLRERTNREIIKPRASCSELAAPFERSALCSTFNDEVRVRRLSFSCCRSLVKWFDNGHVILK